MEILAANLQGVGDFLHAGYISAHPHELYQSAYPPGLQMGDTIADVQPIVELDMVEALRILPQSADAVATKVHAASMAMSPEVLFVSILSAIALSMALTFRRDGSLRRRQWMIMGAAIILLGMGLFFGCGGSEPIHFLGQKPPWNQVLKREYVDKEAATKAIMHGLVMPALVNHDGEVSDLVTLHDEVVIPNATPSKGEWYAAKTYAFDGWGNEFSLSMDGDDTYILVSAGPDTVRNTADDIAVSAHRYSNDKFDMSRYAFFIFRDMAGDKIARVGFHVWNGYMFKEASEGDGKRKMGSTQFDVFRELSKEQQRYAEKKMASFEKQADHRPVVLQVFEHR